MICSMTSSGLEMPARPERIPDAVDLIATVANKHECETPSRIADLRGGNPELSHRGPQFGLFGFRNKLHSSFQAKGLFGILLPLSFPPR